MERGKILETESESSKEDMKMERREQNLKGRNKI